MLRKVFSKPQHLAPLSGFLCKAWSTENFPALSKTPSCPSLTTIQELNAPFFGRFQSSLGPLIGPAPTFSRLFTDDVGDYLVAILTNGRVTEDKVGPHDDFLPEFPYLGPPHENRMEA